VPHSQSSPVSEWLRCLNVLLISPHSACAFAPSGGCLQPRDLSPDWHFGAILHLSRQR
jgi:hypothetical protein